MIDELPADLAALREASSQLVFHYRADGDWAENGVPAERAGEIDTRYADAMFALLLSRGEPTLARKRLPPDRVVGCCRDATVLFLALARRKRIPARARVGFAAYFHPGWLINHVVAEVWDSAAGRWRLVDPEMKSDWKPGAERPRRRLARPRRRPVRDRAPRLAGGPGGYVRPGASAVRPGTRHPGAARLALPSAQRHP